MYVRRKVFSNVEQPVEEQLYSVTMTEEEYDLFSEFLEEYMYADADNVAAASAAGVGAAAALGAAGYGAYEANKAIEGGFKGVASANRNARKAAKEARSAAAKIDEAAVLKSVEGYNPKGADGKLLEGKARERAINKVKEANAKRLKDIRNLKYGESIKAANSSTKEALKKGWAAAKANKKVRYGVAGGAGLAGLAGVYAAGHNRN
jgi:hypothetical protein